MKEITRLMRLDFLTGSPLGLKNYLATLLILSALMLLLAPFFGLYCIFAPAALIGPIVKRTDGDALSKLYGILPVHRKNITRARFLLIFAVYLFTELVLIILAWLSLRLMLIQYLPFQDSQIMQILTEMSTDFGSGKFILYGIFVACCLFGAVISLCKEWAGQLFGRENEMKHFFILLTVFFVMVTAFLYLSMNDIIPMLSLDFDSAPNSLSKNIAICVIANLAVFVLAILLGELTAAKVSQREL